MALTPANAMQSASLLNRPYYLWRLFATGLSFALFGIGGAALSLLLLISVYFSPLSGASKRVYSRRAISASFRLYIALLKKLGLLTYEVHGLEKMRQPGLLVIANHPSLLDVVFLIAFLRQANCVVKSGLYRNPFTFGPVKAAGFLRNDSRDLLERGSQSLRAGNSLIIFPEGTRSVPGHPFKLLRGAANIALAANKDLTPVIIQCQPATLLKKEKWYTIPKHPPHYVFRVLPTIEIHRFRRENTLQCISARHLTNYLCQFFARHCARPIPEVSDHTPRITAIYPVRR